MFYEKYVRLCQQSGKTPNGVAKQLHISSGTVSGWKKGCQPTLDKLDKICVYFNVSPDYFLKTSENQPEPMEHKSSDDDLVALLSSLPPGDVLKVKAFIAGLKAGRKTKEL